MEKAKNKKPSNEALKNYNPANRDFQRTEDEVDNVSGGEKEALEKEHKKKSKK